MQTEITKSNGQTTPKATEPKAHTASGTTVAPEALSTLYRAEKTIADRAQAQKHEDAERAIVRAMARGDAKSEVFRALRPGVKEALRSVRGK